ncbi:GyrI-like domain-containing protein [Ornithinimicrobium flavum]|uniref:GyrI-like domain-containing protein n=1 Tax=Ornithinimicrobium flavum TaxID=1288636 RepID=UPI00106FB960|nr:GyrI-like domain-containing protein [Ornithinimicrobium flavum]
METPEIISCQARPSAVVRGTVPMDQVRTFYDRSFTLVAEVLARQGVQPAEAFGHYLSPPSDTLTLEVGFTVPAPVAGEGEVLAAELPAGRAAFATHLGPYDDLGAAWGRLGEWIGAQGHTPGPDLWEVYVTEPTPTTDPATLRTDLYWLLAD